MMPTSSYSFHQKHVFFWIFKILKKQNLTLYSLNNTSADAEVGSSSRPFKGNNSATDDAYLILFFSSKTCFFFDF
jgi:hypothetical protein